MIRTAVIMAAGMGTRFGKYTELIPKGFVKVNGIPMVIQSIETLISCGIERIIIGTGYHKEAYEALCEDYPEVICCHSPRYAETNCLYTLWNCRNLIGDEDFLMLDSDLIYEPKAITELIECKYPSAILTTSVKKFQDSYFVEEDKRHRFVKWSKNYGELNACGELIGIHKLSNKFFREVCCEFESDLLKNERSSYEPFFQKVSNTKCPIYILKIDDLEWYEIDDEEDLKVAEQSVRIEHKRHTYHTGVKNMLKTPYVCYRNTRYYGHTERINKENAAYLLNTLKKVFEENGIELILAYGTLLGAIREHDFIGHDNDMDTMIWGKHMQKCLDLAPELEKYGIKLECYVLPWIFTYSYKGVTCDIDLINEPIYPLNKRYCLLESQYIQRSFFEHTEKYEFQGEMHNVPAHPEVLLEYHYGKNWRIPGGPHARLQSKLFFWYYIDRQIQRVKRFLKRKLDKEHIQFKEVNVARVLAHMKNIDEFTLNDMLAKYKAEMPDEYNRWIVQFLHTGNAEEIIAKQMFQYMYERHGNFGAILTKFDGNMEHYKDFPWHWVKG